MTEWDDPQTLVTRLDAALAAFDWTTAEALCATIVERSNGSEGRLPDAHAKQVLEALRRKRQIPLMALVGDTLLGLGATDGKIRRQYAQALIEQGQLMAAEGILLELSKNPSLTANERAEAGGLLGRIYKQRYVDANQPANHVQQLNLRTAIRYYYDIYTTDPINRYWHGINAVALLARAARDGVAIEDATLPPYEDLAKAILDVFRRAEDTAGSLDLWQRATALEAHVALQKFDDAKRDLFEYIRNPATDAFECNSTLRQLREVWQIEKDGDAGTFITAGLQGALLRRSGGELELGSQEVSDGLELNFSAIADLTYQWWDRGLRRCAAVARIEDYNGRRVGTGFLVLRSDFAAGVGREGDGSLALLTNWHVISEKGEHPLSIPPDNAVANFEVCGLKVPISKDMIDYSRRLDASLVALRGSHSLTDHCPLKPVPKAFAALPQPRVYVIGYPGGRGLSFSIHDSVWLATDGTRLHYRTPTEPGSSGSPVFDQQDWTLIGLHHAGKHNMPKLSGGGTYEANEAFHVTAIKTAFNTASKT